MQAQLYLNHDYLVPYTPDADTEPGTIVQLDDGRAGVVAGVDKIPADTEGSCHAVGIFKMPIASGLVIADGAEVGWDESAETVLAATNASSDYSVGKARRGGSADGETVIYVALNAHRYDSRDADGHLAGLTLKLTDLPTSDPSVAGEVWSDSGVLTVSAG